MIDTKYEIFESARQARDPRFDGRFFVGVRTTGVYCRPVCRVKMPLAKNVSFFDTAAAASEAGFRPCLRCRPETSPGTPAWSGTSTTVTRALRLIGEGALDDGSVVDLSDRLGVTSRHLGRLFQSHLGASPITIAQTRRLQFAKKLLDETNLSMTDIAYSSGYGSVRRFNDHFKKVYDRTPASLRRQPLERAISGRKLAVDKLVGEKQGSTSDSFTLKLSYRPPFDFSGLTSFLSMRAIPGVESVVEGEYRRLFRFEGELGFLRVTDDEAARALCCKIDMENSRLLVRVVEKVRRLFDLDAVPQDIESQLKKDKPLFRLVSQNPGLRLPGAWDAFEIAVRAIVGQQVSVKGATTVMGRIAETYGQKVSKGIVFPGPENLADIDPSSLPMPLNRANAIKLMAQAVLDGDLDLGSEYDSSILVEQLVAIKGIGPWTAQYVVMRALNDPDAFLHNDLVLMKVAKEKLGIKTEKELLERAEKWRPWRAYAGMHLWRNAV
jgi:AraC family transcriptional regulator, regulatory protein of adaptative response / DNA-3-methyladenine glycosylase II